MLRQATLTEWRAPTAERSRNQQNPDQGSSESALIPRAEPVDLLWLAGFSPVKARSINARAEASRARHLERHNGRLERLPILLACPDVKIVRKPWRN